MDEYELKTLKLLNFPYEIIIVNIGNNDLNTGETTMQFPDSSSYADILEEVMKGLNRQNVIPEYCI